MKAIVTVIGKDRVGITASVCSLLAQHNINILDITQTVLQEYFTMVMLVDTSACQRLHRRDVRPPGAGRQGAGPVHPHPAGGHFQRHASHLMACAVLSAPNRVRRRGADGPERM